jgi:hypothetical protein
MKPHARNEGLLVQEVGEEIVIHDQERRKAHRLNPTAAIVWRNCDGQHSVADMAALLQRKLDAPQNEDLVRLTLALLEKNHLLQRVKAPSVWTTVMSRRKLITTLGKSGMLAFLLPVVSSVVLPSKYIRGFAS